MKKRKIMIGSALLLAVLMIAGGTMAWFTATADPVENKFKAGTVDLKMYERFYNCGAGNVNPGDCFYKNVYVKNTGTKRAKIRIKIDSIFEGMAVNAADGVVKYNLNSNWTMGNDGYAYYKWILPSGYSTHNLFKYDRICFDGPAMNNDYQGKKFTMTLGAEAVQATHGAPWSAVAANQNTINMLGEEKAEVIEILEEGGLEQAPEMSPEMIEFMQENPEGVLEEY